MTRMIKTLAASKTPDGFRYLIEMRGKKFIVPFNDGLDRLLRSSGIGIDMGNYNLVGEETIHHMLLT